MILSGSKITEKVLNKEIIIDPFSIDQVNPNSYNFRLGNILRVYKSELIDPKKNNETEIIEIPPEGYVLNPNILYLGHTQEVIGSNHFVPIIRGRSSIGRIGIFINITADLIDVGFVNQINLQMHCVQPVRVYPGMMIGQVTFWTLKGEIVLYKGKYQGGKGPVASQIYQEFNDAKKTQSVCELSTIGIDA
jgi:dCTP deaminase